MHTKTYPQLLGEISKETALLKAREGIYTGRPLNGYKKVLWSEIHQVDEEKRLPAQAIFELATGGDYSLRTLALECRRVGLTNYSGYPMKFKSVWNMLTNPFYAGYIHIGDELLPGKHEALISEETFEKVQQALGMRRYQ